MNGPAGYAVPLKRPAVDVKRLADGGYIFRSPYGMREAPTHAGFWLKAWATTEPNRIFLVEKGDKGRKRSLNYEQAYASVQQLAAALTAHSQNAHRPVAAFAVNTIDTAILHLAVAEAGVPLATFDPETAGRGNGVGAALKAVLADLAPTVVYVDSSAQRTAVVELSHEVGVQTVAADQIKKWIKKSPKGPDALDASATLSPSVGGRIYFDSEISQGGIGVAARNLTINQEAVAALLPPLDTSVTLACGDSPWWKPAGTWGLLATLRVGGTLHIGAASDGIRPTLLLASGEELAALAAEAEPKRFAALERIMILGGAADPIVAAKIQELAVKARGRKVPLVWGYGVARTGTLDALLYFDSEIPKNLGLPPPGGFLKLAPVNGDLELRVKPAGEALTAWRTGGLTPFALDDDGFLGTGEIATLIDPMRPYLGLQWIRRLI